MVRVCLGSLFVGWLFGLAAFGVLESCGMSDLDTERLI